MAEWETKAICNLFLGFATIGVFSVKQCICCWSQDQQQREVDFGYAHRLLLVLPARHRRVTNKQCIDWGKQDRLG